MLKKYLTGFLILSFLHSPLFAQTKAEKKAAEEAARVARMKTMIQGYGIGDAALIEVKLKTGKKLRGYISASKDESFVVADTAAASSYDVRYAEVASVKPYVLPTGPGNKKMIFLVTLVVVGAVIAGIFGYKYCKKREREGNPCPDAQDSN